MRGLGVDELEISVGHFVLVLDLVSIHATCCSGISLSVNDVVRSRF
jgi:hypothetical protein